jgi:repressor LexA
VFTEKPGQYLAFIYYYTKSHRRPPAEADMQRYFGTSAPSVHNIVVKLRDRGFTTRTPGSARSIQILVAPDEIQIWSNRLNTSITVALT